MLVGCADLNLRAASMRLFGMLSRYKFDTASLVRLTSCSSYVWLRPGIPARTDLPEAGNEANAEGALISPKMLFEAFADEERDCAGCGFAFMANYSL